VKADEKKLLELFVRKHVIRKSELKRILGNNGEGAVNSLLEKGFIIELTAIGERAFAITQKGMKFMEEI